MPAAPRGVLFDLGNTLLDEGGNDFERGCERVLSLAENPRGISARELAVLVKELLDDVQERRDRSWLEISPFARHRLVFEPQGLSFRSSFYEVERELLRGLTRFDPAPGIREALAQLKQAGVPMGVVSNSSFTAEALAWQLAEWDLRGFFRFVLSSADVGVRKPHPRIFAAACAQLGTRPEDTWFVGDALRYDVAGARSAGLVSVWYNPKRAPRDGVDPDVEIHHHAELRSRIEEVS
jgi:putative hydrolase of the HAD superfamily